MECLRDQFVPDQLLDGRYLTVAPLNHGSFGMVFLAKDTLTDQQVAIKCLTKPSTTGQPNGPAVDDIAEEVECHKRAGSHPSLVNMLHSFESSSHIFLVLEYCSMGDLYEAIKNDRGPLETEHVRDFMLQLISAVEHMHSKGLYHRDIKPENIFLCQDGSMKLGDFGLATRGTWSYEACVGSDRYMAPEQYDPTPSGYATPEADIWSIGICLLNVLFARNPFVTPTETDVLFADYTRDRESLFDVFPNMSQDTFQVLVHSMALDPKKRSLSALRQATLRTLSFTTDDETLDEFCTEDRDVVPAQADREPLRTPSIQSPQINQGDSFPWAKALQATPQQPVRQLSAIPDVVEGYTEDLFPASEFEGTSWYSRQPPSPSASSAVDSSLGGSFQSLAVGKPTSRYPPQSEPIPISGSLPTTSLIGAKPIPAMSMVFGKGKSDQMSKSWSDLWDEEEEMEQRFSRQERSNDRSWSQHSKEENVNAHTSALSEVGNTRPAASAAPRRENIFIPSPLKSATPMKENAPHPHSQCPASRQSPSKERSALDKWAALGDKRRNHHPGEIDSPRSNKAQSPTNLSWRKNAGSNSPRQRSRQRSPQPDCRRELLNKDWRHDPFQTIKSKKNVFPISKYDGAIDDDFDWIGGWHDIHV